MKLSDAIIRNHPKPEKGETVLVDSSLGGFVVRIRATGSRAYYIAGRVRGSGQRRVICLGPAGDKDAQSYEQARAKAAKIKLALSEGRDPVAEKAEAREAQAAIAKITSRTFNDAAQEYLELHKIGRLTGQDRSRPPTPRSIMSEAVDVRRACAILGDKAVIDIDTSDITHLVEQSKYAGTGTRRLWGVVRRIMRRELTLKHTAKDVFAGQESPKASAARERALSPDEIRAVWAAEFTGSALVKFAFCLPLRRALLLAMRWDQISEDGIITLASDLEGNKAGVVFKLPIPQIGLDLLATLPRRGPFVFGGLRPMSTSGDVMARALEASGTADWSLHDARRTWCTQVFETIPSPDIDAIETMMMHKRKGIGAIYNRSVRPEALARVANHWDGALRAILNPPTASNVVQLNAVG
jgi:integrase